MKKVIVDVNGADRGPTEVTEGALKALTVCGGFGIILAGNEAETAETVKKLSKKYVFDAERLSYLDAPRTITNDDPPTLVIKGGEGTSMAEALKALKKDDEICGLVSCGNTGALLVGSIFILGLEKGLKRPALAALLPTCEGKMICVTDCGSNMDCKAEELAIFARLGSDLIKETYGVERPAVALLSVGKEPHKGNLLTHAAFDLLKESELNFIGNAEPEMIYTGEADVIVSDGFPGNILLKNTEATGMAIMGMINGMTEGEEDPHTLEVLSKIRSKIMTTHEFNSRGGAVFLGTSKKIVKGHGAANKDTVSSCIMQILGKNQYFISANR